jgi:NADPH:quinone reductase-like Zn-dependent oxidoreductase
MAALTVWQGIVEHTNLKAGQTVLINGAAGGTGHFALQLAKARGARVIGIASGRHEAFLRELGVDAFIDYTTTSPEQMGRVVDLVIDTVGTMGENPLLLTLKRGGTLLWIGLRPMNNGIAIGTERTEAGVTIEKIQVRSNGTHLAAIGELIDAGQLRVTVDTVVPLAEASLAHERGESGHLRGIIVLRVVAAVTSKQHPFSAEELQPRDYLRWRKLRAQLQQREECRRQQFRFRKDLAGYLAALEAQLLM